MMKSWKKYLFFDFELFEIFIKKIIITQKLKKSLKLIIKITNN